MVDWKCIRIAPDTEVQDTMKIINRYALQLALVVDENDKLLGTVTDGDIRRSILRGTTLNEPIEKVMNKNPITINAFEERSDILKIFKATKLHHLPRVDDQGRVTGIERLEDFLHAFKKENWVVLMVGGLGSRLRPLTNDCPKSMLLIHEQPLLEIVLNHFIKQGFHRFCMSINYKGEQIRDYFGDGSKWGVEIHYIHEEKRMGTAGSLSLFSMETKEPIIVMNGDILTKLNFEHLVEYHRENQGAATVAVKNYAVEIPYGVVKVKKNRLIGFDEKPVYTNFINAGIYVLNPKVLNNIPRNQYFDMSQLLKTMLVNDEKISIFPICEYWIDIGKVSDFNQAKLDFNEVFT